MKPAGQGKTLARTMVKRVGPGKGKGEGQTTPWPGSGKTKSSSDMQETGREMTLIRAQRDKLGDH
jgi:hypothetical protein